MQASPQTESPDVDRLGRVIGNGFAIAISLVLLFIVQNIVEWGWLPFLTEEFNDLVPLISFSLIVSMLTYAVFMFSDHPTLKSWGQILTNLISLYVTWQVLVVFPFSFDEGGFDWALAFRIVLIVAMVGIAASTIVEVVKLARARGA